MLQVSEKRCEVIFNNFCELLNSYLIFLFELPVDTESLCLLIFFWIELWCILLTYQEMRVVLITLALSVTTAVSSFSLYERALCFVKRAQNGRTEASLCAHSYKCAATLHAEL